jgi:hypothetical protein
MIARNRGRIWRGSRSFESGCSKRPASKAAGNYLLLRGGWDDPNCARPTRGVRDRALREHGDRSSYPALRFDQPQQGIDG